MPSCFRLSLGCFFFYIINNTHASNPFKTPVGVEKDEKLSGVGLYDLAPIICNVSELQTL
jgi:hypothetical protein